MTGDVAAVINRLAKWRTVFAGWQLGTRSTEDPECQAVKDHRELTILLRAEVSALLQLLVNKGVFGWEEYYRQLLIEATALNASYERRFPGFKVTDEGIVMTPPEAFETMRGWRP